LSAPPGRQVVLEAFADPPLVLPDFRFVDDTTRHIAAVLRGLSFQEVRPFDTRFGSHAWVEPDDSPWEH